MSTSVKVAIAFNVFLTLIVVVIVLSVGVAPAPFAPDLRDSVEITMVPVQFAPAKSAVDDAKNETAHSGRIEIPPEFRTPDLSPSPWIILQDGTVRFRELNRR